MTTEITENTEILICTGGKLDGNDLIDDVLEPDPALNQMTNAIIGAAMEVHRQLGLGHLESTYEEALAIELTLRRIPYERQVAIAVDYKGHPVGQSRLDFLIYDQIIVELKVVDEISRIHVATAISYLKITGKKLALILNFRVRALKDGVRRIAL